MQITESKKLVDHIDLPIRKCVAGMALLGYKPLMSCCGFNYKGQEETRTHLNKPYMYLDATRSGMPMNQRANFMNIVLGSGWSVNRLGPSMDILDFFGAVWQKDHPWGDAGCVHNHEMAALAIHALEKVLETNRGGFRDEVELVDGNASLYKGIEHWQYDPAEPWIITPDTFDNINKPRYANSK